MGQRPDSEGHAGKVKSLPQAVLEAWGWRTRKEARLRGWVLYLGSEGPLSLEVTEPTKERDG